MLREERVEFVAMPDPNLTQPATTWGSRYAGTLGRLVGAVQKIGDKFLDFVDAATGVVRRQTHVADNQQIVRKALLPLALRVHPLRELVADLTFEPGEVVARLHERLALLCLHHGVSVPQTVGLVGRCRPVDRAGVGGLAATVRASAVDFHARADH